MVSGEGEMQIIDNSKPSTPGVDGLTQGSRPEQKGVLGGWKGKAAAIAVGLGLAFGAKTGTLDHPVDAAGNALGDGVGMVAGGVNDAAEGAAGKIMDTGGAAVGTVKDAVFSEEIQKEFEIRQMEGTPVTGEVVKAKFFPILNEKGEIRNNVIFRKGGPSMGYEEVDPKEIGFNLNSEPEGIIVWGRNVPKREVPGAEPDDGRVDMDEWFKFGLDGETYFVGPNFYKTEKLENSQ